MFKLTIDGKTAVIKTGTSIKLTRENPLVTESGDYTFDVQLPLRGCPENIEIFGALYRPEVSISAVAGRRLPFTLITDVFSISGKAVVTSVTQDEAKVQLLAGRSALTEILKDDNGRDIYIDELDLGRMFDDLDNESLQEYYSQMAERYGQDWDINNNSLSDILMRIRIAKILCDQMLSEKSDNIIHKDANESAFVAFPVYSMEDEFESNKFAIHHRNIGQENAFYLFCFNSLEQYTSHLAVQPYLVSVIERILEAVGLQVGLNQIRQSWMRNIFIANAKNCLRVKSILPHWTVEQFLEEIEHFFGCFIDISNSDTTIKTYENALNGLRTVELHEVVDETSCDIDIDDEERLESMMTGNIEYAEFYESKILRLPDEVWEKAIVKIFDTKSEMTSWISENLNETDIEKSKYLFCVKEENKVYAHLEQYQNADSSYSFALCEVDFCPALIRNGQFSQKNRDVDITLNITPVLSKWVAIDYVKNQTTYPDNTAAYELITPDSTYLDYTDDYSVNDAIINEEEDEEEKPEIIPIAWNTMRTQIVADSTTQTTRTFQIPFAVGLPYRIYDESFLSHEEFHKITYPPGIDNLCLSSREFASTRFSQNMKTNVVRQFSFTDNINPEPLAIYLIRGKRYLCQKIELTIDEKGVNPLKKGYFYELN